MAREAWLAVASFVLACPACDIDSRDLLEQPLSGAEAGAGGTDFEPIAGAGGAGSNGAAGAGGAVDAAGGVSDGSTLSASGGHAAGGASAGAASGGKATNGGASVGASGGVVTNGGVANGGANSGGRSASGGVANAGGSASSGSLATSCPDLDGNKTPDCSETLVKDATFESPFNPSQSNWKLDVGMGAAWDSLDAGSGAPSGSLLLTNQATTTESLTQVGAAQCIPASAGKAYSVYAQSYAQATSGGVFARVTLTYFMQSGCTGSPAATAVAPLDGTTNTWRVLQVPRSTAEQGVTSLSVRLEVLKLSSAPSASVRFDNVLLRAD